jgi:hypothetical protein
MKPLRPNTRWLLIMAAALVSLSAALFLLHFRIFHDAHNLFFYLLHGIASLPLQVLFVTLFMERIMAHREKSSLMHKLNMAIGAFFGETGTALMRRLQPGDIRQDQYREHLLFRSDWTFDRFSKSIRVVRQASLAIDLTDRPDGFADLPQGAPRLPAGHAAKPVTARA